METNYEKMKPTRRHLSVTGNYKVPTHSATHCAVGTTLGVIDGKWKPIILWHLGEGGVTRFLALQRMIPGITRKMLTQHLRELESDQIVARKVFNELPQHVEYSLTKYGGTLRPLLRELCEWGRAHEAKVTRNGDKEPANRPAHNNEKRSQLVKAAGKAVVSVG